MSEPLRELLHKAHELAELTAAFTRHAIERNFEAMALDVTAITAATTELERIATAAQAGDSAAIQSAVAAAQESDQATQNAATGPLTAAVAKLTAEFPPASTGAGSLTVSPTSISSPVGATISQALTVTGGVSPYTFTSNLADVTVDGSGNVGGSPAAAETGAIAVTDSSSPPLTASVPVSIA